MKKTWLELRPKVLRRIKPSADMTRRAQSASKRLFARALAAAKPHGLAIEPRLVGSLEKGTHLEPKTDIDVFLLFSPTVGRADLERVGTAIGKKILNRPTLRYAEHPYVRGRFSGFTFDVVPAYKVEEASGRLSAVDRSPFHADYVRARLTARQRDEVRILKQFLKGIGGYGAETATGGFSGYLAELLVLKYGDFWTTLWKMRELMPPILLALQGTPAPLGGDLVFVDPVDVSRNAAAAVSTEKLDTFLRGARAFTAAPRLEFFWPRKPKTQTETELISHLSHRGIVGMAVPAPKVRPEARLPHVRRFADKVLRRLENEGFRVVRHMVHPVSARRLLVFWEHEPVALAPSYQRVGPPVDAVDHSRRFLEKWQSHPDALQIPHPDKGRWVVDVRRREREASQVLARHMAELLKGLELPAKGPRPKPQPGVHFLKEAAGRAALSRFLVPRDPWDA